MLILLLCALVKLQMWSRLVGIVLVTGGGVLTLTLNSLCAANRSPPLCTKQTPTWLALIFLFFSPRMLALWRRLAFGICVGLIADIVTETNSWPLWWRDIL